MVSKKGKCIDCYYLGEEAGQCVCKHDWMLFGSKEARIVWSPNNEGCYKFLSYAEGEQIGFSRKKKL